MFTGIVQEAGVIKGIKPTARSIELTVSAGASARGRAVDRQAASARARGRRPGASAADLTPLAPAAFGCFPLPVGVWLSPFPLRGNKAAGRAA